MNKIVFEINRETNFVFHMLSVSKCGYENAYGEKYRHLHSEADLAVLKKYENDLTVRGGAHCGRLYWYLVCLPARGEISAAKYYEDFQPAPEIEELSEICAQICGVMIRNYDIYTAKVWPETQQGILTYVPQIQKLFDGSGFTDRTESLVAAQIPEFRVMLTNSVAYGAEAIDISETQDVFGIDRTPEDAFFFVGHEYLIFLLKKALKDTSAFQSFETWAITEGLAEFFLKRITGSLHFFRFTEDKVSYYEELSKENPGITAKELYLRAEAEFCAG